MFYGTMNIQITVMKQFFFLLVSSGDTVIWSLIFAVSERAL